MLRRHLRKFIESLYDGLDDEKRSIARAARGVTATKKSKSGKATKGEDVDCGGFVKDEFGIYERGVHMRGVLAPRAYLCVFFSYPFLLFTRVITLCILLQ